MTESTKLLKPWLERYAERWRRRDWRTAADVVAGMRHPEPWGAWARRCIFDVKLEVEILGFSFVISIFNWHFGFNRGILKLGPFYIYAE